MNTRAIALVGLCGLLSACTNTRSDYGEERSTTERPRTGGVYTQREAGSWAMSPDARILSILHAKNQEEIEMARLADRSASSEDIRQFARTLIRDHTDADAKVMETARSAGIGLADRAEVGRLLQSEKGVTSAPPDPVAELRALQGAEFDRAFARKMHERHEDSIRRVESAQQGAQDAKVRDLLANLLPVLRQHRDAAAGLKDR